VRCSRAGATHSTTANSNEIYGLPTMHRNHPSVFCSHHPSQPFPLGTETIASSTHENIPTIFAHAGKLFMQHPRSSQPQPSHHHTSEHSNSWTIILHGSHRSIGQTTHCQKPGPIFCPANADQKTSTRIQTHQNLFTLTKNISAPPKQLDWEQTSNEPRTSPSQSNDPSPKKLDFPITSN